VVVVVDGVVGDERFDTPNGRSDRAAAKEQAVLSETGCGVRSMRFVIQLKAVCDS
jgi:hypothetical protein